MTGDALRGLSMGAGPRLTAGSGATNAGSGAGAAGGATGAGETTAAARRTAKAIRDFQAVFLMEMMKPLTQELAGASTEDPAEAGLGISSGADVYSYFWGEALAQRLAGALPGLPGVTVGKEETDPAGGGTAHGRLPRMAAPTGSPAAKDAPAAGIGPAAGPLPNPVLADRQDSGFEPLTAGVMRDGLSALAAVRAAGAASPDATAAAAPSASAPGRSAGGPTLPAAVHALADKAGRLFSLPENLVRAVVAVESGGRTGAVSDKGAVGLMQLMPGTASEMGVKDPRDAWDNLVGGAKYLARQLERFGRLDHALAAYNAGPGAVEKHGGVPPYPETRDYVRRVLAVKARLDNSKPAGI